jgi:hypothetical protein
MPVGWAMSPPSSGSGSFQGCFNVHTSFAKYHHPYHDGQVGFQAGDGIPEVVELVASWASTSVATTAWKTVNAVFANCHKVTSTFNDKTVAFTIEPMNLPQVGGSSAAYDMSGTLGGLPVVFVIDWAYKGRAVMVFAYVDLGNPPTSQVVHLLRVAAAKIKG